MPDNASRRGLPVNSVCAIVVLVALAISFLFSSWPSSYAAGPSGSRKSRLVVLMVWDGLRPDSVTRRTTPELFALAAEGVRFDRHHAIFPTLTMVNAAAIATGVMPARNGLVGNVMYFAPFFPRPTSPAATDDIRREVRYPLFIENSLLLVRLNGRSGLDGRLLTADSIGQELEREGGFLAVVGKRGPTMMFDDRVDTVSDGRDRFGLPHADYMFVASDLIEPAALAAQIKERFPRHDPTEIAQDAVATQIVVKYALPRAKAALEAGRPALIVLWQRNPDASQHRYGLGTAAALRSLAACDANLAALRRAIAELGLADLTDLIVVSDHGFATVKASIKLDSLLVRAGLKRSLDSDDIVVAGNGGCDELFLSRESFPTPQARRSVLSKIVALIATQSWCGPIFSRPASPQDSSSASGAVAGTFNLARLGLFDPARSPDLIVAYRELPEVDNSRLTGPTNPAFVLDGESFRSTANNSSAVVEPVKGAVYSDLAGDFFTTGMGMHGAAGPRELHNFAAAIGPDFRRHFVDNLPTGSLDLAPTVAYLLGLKHPFGSTQVELQGRVLSESLIDHGSDPIDIRHYDLRVDLALPKARVSSLLHLSAVGQEEYVDSSDVTVTPSAGAPRR